MVKRVCVLVCQNGLGHFRRAADVVDRLCEVAPGSLRVDVHAGEWQLEMTAGWEVTRRLRAKDGVRFHHHTLEGSPVWGSGGEDADAYLAWIDRSALDETILSSDLVVSDNLVGVLGAREDAILMGSFLWHDVVRDRSVDGARIAAVDDALLEAARPPMLCVGDIAMPAVERQTRAIRLPWFCETAADPAPPRWPPCDVLLLGGATDAATGTLREIARSLLDSTSCVVHAPERLLGVLASRSSRTRGFRYRDEEFARCDVVIGRPGVGTLTDCVRHRIPLLAIDDVDNGEIRHNARRVAELGLGVIIPANRAGPAAARLLRGGLTESDFDRWRANLAALRTGGAAAAAEHLRSLL